MRQANDACVQVPLSQRFGGTAKRTGPLKTDYRAPGSLDAAERDELWTFISRFADYDRTTWEHRLLTCEEIFLGRDRRGTLQAFGAINVLLTTWQGRTHGLLFTSVTAVDPAYRGSNLYQWVGLRCLLRFRLRHPLMPLYWFFWAGNYKSYLLMARNCLTYWPHPDQPWPARERHLVGQAMDRLVGDGWDRERVVLLRYNRFKEGHVAREVPGATDPDIRFFASLNPEQHLGDALVCLAPMSWQNWLSAIVRMVGRAWRRHCR